MVGKLIPDFFPKIFGPARTSRSMPTRCARLRRARARDRRRPHARGGRRRLHPDRGREHGERDQEDFRAARLRRYRYTLNCFGGAGGQHACLVADALGMTTVLIHPSRRCSRPTAWASPTSAPRASRRSRRRSARRRIATLNKIGRRLSKDVSREVVGQGVPAKSIEVFVRAHIRYAGTDTALVVGAGASSAMKSASTKPTRPIRLYRRAKELVVEAVSVEAVGGGARFKGRW